VLVADCVPVVLFDPKAQVIAVAHAGRRGVVSGVVPRTLEVMAEFGAQRSDVRVWTGPSICARCYEVSAEVRDEVERAAPGSGSTTSSGTPSVDLKAALRHQLAGVRAIDDDVVCTAESPDHFSYRRDGRTGRFAAYIHMASQ
jgi:YfiH family protein